MSNLSPHAKPFDPETWCMEPRTPTPDFSPLSLHAPLRDPAHQPLSYATATKTKVPEPFPAYESPPQTQTIFHGHPQQHLQAQSQRQTYRQEGGEAQPWRSPIWNTPSRFNLHTHGDQSRPVGEYGIALDAPLPPFGQGKWVNGGPDRQEMAPIGSERSQWTTNLGNLTMAARSKKWGEQQRHFSSTGSSTNGSGSSGASTSSAHETSTTNSPTTSLSTAASPFNITTPLKPFTATHPVTPISLYFNSASSREACPDGLHLQTNEDDDAQAKGIVLEKQYVELVGTLSNGMPAINMQELKEKFEVPDMLDGSTYQSLSDFANHSVLTGNLTRIEGHIIARQLFHARCKRASASAVETSTKAFADVTIRDAAEAAGVKASASAASFKTTAFSPVSSRLSTRAYIPTVSSRIGADALKATLAAFGEVTYFDINRQKRCAFVEFATPAQFRAAFDANPHRVGKGRDIIRVEARRKNGR